jgi:hypothetical protein
MGWVAAFGDPQLEALVAAAIYTSSGKPFSIVRKVIIRMYTFMNYF